MKKLDISYCTSSGPGGQNVNRLFTKATVKLNLASADWIPDDVKTRIQDLVSIELVMEFCVLFNL